MSGRASGATASRFDRDALWSNHRYAVNATLKDGMMGMERPTLEESRALLMPSCQVKENRSLNTRNETVSVRPRLICIYRDNNLLSLHVIMHL
jgi:hypothetical protein